MDDIQISIFLAVMGFIAAFVDAVVGGGGLISIPTLMSTGLPPIQVLGTNKACSVLGALSSFITFIRSGKVDIDLVKKLCPISLIGSAIGVFLVRMIPSDFLRPLVIVMLIAVAIYSMVRKDWGDTSSYKGMTKKTMLLSMLTALCFGIYDGFFGPGTGSFLLFAFLCIGFDFLRAAANARALNFASNLSAVILFIYLDQVNYSYVLPMGLAMILGARCGAKMALSKGAAYVRPLFIVMTTVLIGKQIFDYFH